VLFTQLPDCHFSRVLAFVGTSPANACFQVADRKIDDGDHGGVGERHWRLHWPAGQPEVLPGVATDDEPPQKRALAARTECGNRATKPILGGDARSQPAE
jgi:hypothetical protein